MMNIEVCTSKPMCPRVYPKSLCYIPTVANSFTTNILFSYRCTAICFTTDRQCSIPLRLCSCIMLLLWAFLILPPQFHWRSGITGSSSRFPLVFKGMLAAISFHCCRFPCRFPWFSKGMLAAIIFHCCP